MIIVESAVERADPHSPLIVFQDGADGVVSQRVFIFVGEGVFLYRGGFRFENEQGVDGSYPDSAFVILCQCADRFEGRLPLPVIVKIVFLYLEFFVYRVHTVDKRTQPAGSFRGS